MLHLDTARSEGRKRRRRRRRWWWWWWGGGRRKGRSSSSGNSSSSSSSSGNSNSSSGSGMCAVRHINSLEASGPLIRRPPPSPPTPPPPPPPRLPTPPLLLLLLFLLQNHSSLMVDAFRDNSDVDRDTSVVEVVAGFNASLPCTIRIPQHDSPLLTLWYLGEDETPVYSYDQRTGVSGTSWADPHVFGGRAHYLAHLSPPAMLIISSGIEDAQLYRCRIDFHNSNSRIAWIKLKVIVPPERVDIIPQVSPVILGQKDDVVCTAVGGNPLPSVVWWQAGRVVDPNSTVGQSGTYNRLEVPASRLDLLEPFTCQASNNELTPPVYAIYSRNVTCGPYKVTLESSENPLVEGRPAEVSCTAVGSNPPAEVTWYHQGKVIQNLLVNVTRKDNETVSVLSLKPDRHYHARQLLCRAENPSMPLATLEDIITLNVAYRPYVRIDLVWPSRLELIREGSDLHLECLVDANPPPYKIKFFHNGVELVPTEGEGVEVTDATLAIRHVKREQAGVYHCQASNVQGDSTSKNVTISVRYIPVCAMNSTVVGAVVGEMTSMTCKVYAYPDNVNFTWTLIKDPRRMRPRFIDTADYTCDGLRSTLYFTPTSMRDFGVISCYATNPQGIQQKPCTFKLVPAGPPESVNNCSVAKVTARTLSIACRPGEFSGGLPQQFFHQIRKSASGELVFNKSSTEASLDVQSLHPGQRYVVTVTAFNARGKAPPKSFHIQTPQEAKMHISLPSRPEPQRLMWVMGVGAGVIITVLILFVVLWKTHARRDSHTIRNRDNDVNKPNNTELTGEVRGIGDGLCVNGLMQQTIYDATGRYRGFAHMQKVEVQPSSTATPPEKPTLESRFSLPRKESLLNRGLKAAADTEGKGTKDAAGKGEGGANAPQGSKGGATDEDDPDGTKKQPGFMRWRWVMKNVAVSGNGSENSPSTGSRFLDICRLAESKHLQGQQDKKTHLQGQQDKKTESAL